MKYLNILFTLTILIVSCKKNSEQNFKENNFAGKNSDGYINKDSNSAPVVHIIAAANLPKTIVTGKPVLINNPLKNGFGYPKFTNYGTEQGMAISNALCGYKDRKGNLWFGTNGGGVSRYDGHLFTNFTYAQGLGHHIIKSIYEDHSGNLWFGAWGGGVIKYDGSYSKRYSTTDGLANDLVTCIIEDRNGKIWISTDGGGVSMYDPSIGNSVASYGKPNQPVFKNYTKDHGLASNNINCMTEDNKGNIWFGTNGSGISCFDGKSFINYTTVDGLVNNHIWSVYQDQKKRIWFGTEGGVSYFNPEPSINKNEKNKINQFISFTVKDGLAFNNVRAIKEDRSGSLWFGTYAGGVSLYNGKSFITYTTDDGLLSNVINSITMDNSGNLWFGTNGGGISRYDGNALSYFSLGKGEMPFGIIADKNNNIWFGTFGGGAYKYDGNTFMNYTTQQGLSNNMVNCFLEDHSGKIWIGTESGLSCFDGKSFTNYTTEQGLSNNRINNLTEDQYGNLWIATYGGGISKYDGNIVEALEKGEKIAPEIVNKLYKLKGKFVKSFTNYTTAQGLANNNLWGITIDKRGHVWAVSSGGGASRFDGKQFINYTIKHGLADNNIDAITTEKNGNIWLGSSGGGINWYDGKTFSTLTSAQGLSDNVIYVLKEDTMNNLLWIGTNLGLSALKLKTYKDKKPEFENFNERTGYAIKDLNSNAIFVDKKGVLWAGCGDAKIIRFDYKSLNKNNNKPELVIKNILLNNEPICWNNLKKELTKTETDSLILLNEMIAAFGKSLNQTELDRMKNKYGSVQFDSISKFYSIPSNLILPYENNNISFEFAAIEPALGRQMKYQYLLEGYDKEWSQLNHSTNAGFGNISEGKYTLRIRALNPFGVWSETSYTFSVLPPRSRTWWAYLLYIITMAGLFYIIYRWRTTNLRHSKILLENKVEKRTEQLKAEKKKSDDLLLNILPSEIADELKQNGTSAARLYNHVTVLFTDFVNFTGISEEMSPTELVHEIHESFTAFDAIVESHGLEKIKTIGDAYLAVCGLPNELPDHAQRVVKAAIDIKNFIEQNNSKFQIRIGIHSGPVVAGIVGIRKFAYDIWGDTVNTANRMESSSEKGKINISSNTYELIKHEFKCSYRGRITVKNKGELEMYFVDELII